MKLEWTSQPPRIEGWWFVSSKRGKKRRVNIVEVRQYHRKWQWSYIYELGWYSTDEYPQCQWCLVPMPPL
jgi:hypothetical protein